MGRERIEVQAQAIAGEERKAAWGEALAEGMDDRMSHVLRAGTQREDGKNLRAGIYGQPEPQNLFGATEPRMQFVQLQVRQVQMAEEALVQGVRVLACAR